MLDPDRTARPFADWLIEQRGGRLHAEVTTALGELLDAVIEHDKGGSLTIVIRVRPAGSGVGAGTVFVTDDVVVKAPSGERPAALFYVDDDRNLTRHDPRQQSFDSLREVPPIPETTKEVARNA